MTNHKKLLYILNHKMLFYKKFQSSILIYLFYQNSRYSLFFLSDSDGYRTFSENSKK